MFIRQFGVATSITIPLIKAGTEDFAASGDWTPATGDVKISKDGGAFANITTLPSAVSGGNAWSFSFSATEMQANRIEVLIVDSATKAVKDDGFAIDTNIYGLPLMRAQTAQSATSSTIVLDASASAVDDFYNGAFITAGGQIRQIIDYVGSTKTALVYSAGPPAAGALWATTPSGTGLAYMIHGFAIQPVAVAVNSSGHFILQDGSLTNAKFGTGALAAANFADGFLTPAKVATTLPASLDGTATAAVADRILGRNVAGGSDGGRTVAQSFYVLRNKVAIDTVNNLLVVYGVDDTTPAFSAAISLANRNALVGVDPT